MDPEEALIQLKKGSTKNKAQVGGISEAGEKKKFTQKNFLS